MKKSFRVLMMLGFMMVVAVSVVNHGKWSNGNNAEQGRENDPNSVPVGQAETPVMDSYDDKIKIVIDPGHGGEDPGATGASGSYEKDFTLAVALKLFRLLENEAEFDVYLTREDDRFLSSETRERTEVANSIGADLFISLHANTFTDQSVSGTETYYYDDESKVLADTIHPHVVEATGFPDRGVRQEAYFVLKDTMMPSILIEIGYITNERDERLMLTESFQQAVAESIVAGVKEYVANQMDSVTEELRFVQ